MQLLRRSEFALLKMRMRKVQPMSTRWIRSKDKHFYDKYIRHGIPSRVKANVKLAIPSGDIEYLLKFMTDFEIGYTDKYLFRRNLSSRLVMTKGIYGLTRFNINSFAAEKDALHLFAQCNPN